jgi:hypothetical protein
MGWRLASFAFGIALEAGCGTSAGLDGRSSQTLQVGVGVNARVTLDGTLADVRFVASVHDLSENPVTDATVTFSLDGELHAVPPSDVEGLYVEILPAYPTATLIETDIRRGEDYLEDVGLSLLPLHSVAIEPSSLTVGRRVDVSWDPNGDSGVFCGLGVVNLTTDEVVAAEPTLSDTGRFQGQVAFATPGSWHFALSRNLLWRLDSPDSVGLSFVLVEDDVEVVP